jgi:dolichol-phosphate mannosyltransferase
MIRALFSLDVPGLSVLIVDDSSPDGTADEVKKLQSEFPNLHLAIRAKKSGLGRAYTFGFEEVLKKGATAIVQMDADFSHDPKDVPRLLAGLKENDVVIGSRYSHGISVINWPLRRLLLSTAANQYARIITGLKQHDITGGFRAWRPEVLRAIDLSTVRADGYGFQIVTIFRTAKKKFRITEIPIIFTERREGQSKMSRAIMWEAFWLVWKLRLVG